MWVLERVVQIGPVVGIGWERSGRSFGLWREWLGQSFGWDSTGPSCGKARFDTSEREVRVRIVVRKGLFRGGRDSRLIGLG